MSTIEKEVWYQQQGSPLVLMELLMRQDVVESPHSEPNSSPIPQHQHVVNTQGMTFQTWSVSLSLAGC